MSSLDEKHKENGTTPMAPEIHDGSGNKTDANMMPEVETRTPEVQDEEKETGAKPQFPPFHPMNNPDGGRQAWLNVVGGWCCL